jgi:undecaprenyl-diphosphatase
MYLPDWIDAIILGIVEGLTEFLPISSTGHLLITGQALGFKSELFTIFIQIGALAAVWWLFRDRIIKMIPTGGSNKTGLQLATNVLIGFLPAMVVGYLAHHWVKEHLFSVKAIAGASIVGGIIILLIEGLKPKVSIEKIESITPVLALAVGVGQCLALYPGVSRSGATIMTGLLLGFSRSVAIEFTFLLAIPTMTAAGVYELVKYRHELTSSMIGLLAIGFIVSFIVAFLVVKWLIRFVQSHTFNGFAWYRIVMGIVVLILVWRGILLNET